MADPVTSIPLQTPTATVKSAAALQASLNGSPYVIEYVIPCHPLMQQWEFVTTVANPVSTVIVNTPGVGSRTALTMLAAFLSLDCTVNVSVRIGLATAPLPPEALVGVAGICMNHQLAPGGGLIIGNGGSVICLGPNNGALRLVNTVPTGGKLVILASYFQPSIA